MQDPRLGLAGHRAHGSSPFATRLPSHGAGSLCPGAQCRDREAPAEVALPSQRGTARSRKQNGARAEAELAAAGKPPPHRAAPGPAVSVLGAGGCTPRPGDSLRCRSRYGTCQLPLGPVLCQGPDGLPDGPCRRDRSLQGPAPGGAGHRGAGPGRSGGRRGLGQLPWGAASRSPRAPVPRPDLSHPSPGRKKASVKGNYSYRGLGPRLSAQGPGAHPPTVEAWPSPLAPATAPGHELAALGWGSRGRQSHEPPRLSRGTNVCGSWRPNPVSLLGAAPGCDRASRGRG